MVNIYLNVWKFGIVLAFLVLPPTLSTTCKFPDFVTNRRMWIATYDNDATLRAEITSDTISASDCTQNGLFCAEYIRKCNETRDQDKFIVKHTDKTQPLAVTEYLCIQFLKRSDDVIQIKTSTKMSVKSPSICDNLNLDHWPLTSPSFRTANPIMCPFSGGYNMLIRKNGKQLCPSRIPRPRMESQCTVGTGIVFDFKHEECQYDTLKMDLVQSVDCMAEWTVGDQRFVILRPDADDFQPYCLRLTSGDGEISHAYLFMDFICDPGNSHGTPTKSFNYLSIDFEKYVISSLCEDEFQECTESKYCNTDMEAHCKKSCSHCKPEANICVIPESMRGSWGLLETNITGVLDITTYEFRHSKSGSLQCLKTNSTEKNQLVLLKTFENGCYPKFSCLEVTHTSPSIIQYRLGKSVSWPIFPLYTVGKLACQDEQFSTKVVVGKNKQMIEIQKITAVDPNYYYGVDCGLSEEFYDGVYSLYFQEGSKCDGCISFDARYNKTAFTISTIECSNAEKELKYVCLASLKLGTNTSAVITKRKSEIDEFLCWVFTGSGASRKLVVLKVSNCNEFSVRLVLEGHIKPRASFDILENAPKECPQRTIREVPLNTVKYIPNKHSVVTVNIPGNGSSHMRKTVLMTGISIMICFLMKII